MKVLKFGGTSVGSGEMILNATEIIKNEPDKDKIVVVSALSGVTNNLDRIGNLITTLPAIVIESKVNQFIDDISKHHFSVSKIAIKNNKIREIVDKRLSELFDKLRITLLGVGYLEELTPKSRDFILSFGERLSIQIVAGCMESQGIPAKPLTGYEAGIITDSHFGKAHPKYELMKTSIPMKLLPIVREGTIPVVSGFIAANEKGEITTLGRGGSDYTASLIGRFINANEVQIWTDVDGIFSSDPKIVKDAKMIKELSYEEAMDLAYFGAKVIHSKMIEPAMVADIPVVVKNTFNPASSGTIIVKEQKKIESVVKAITKMDNIALIKIGGIGMIETPNIVGRIFTLLGEKNINIVMISGASESNLSFVIEKSELKKAEDAIAAGLIGNGINNIKVDEEVSMITVIGAGMRGTKGIAAKIFKAVSDVDKNIIMIAQGSSEVNISFVVRSMDANEILLELHKRFISAVK